MKRTLLAVLALVWGSGVTSAQLDDEGLREALERADAADVDSLELDALELSDATREALEEVARGEEPVDAADEADMDQEVAERQPVDLPTGTSATSSVGPQTIPLPSGEGSIEGMGESFTPMLSSGTGTFSVPIATPAGRGGVGPSLSLGYSTSGGNGTVGFGWGMGTSCIYRQSDRGLPRYVDEDVWHEEEDDFMYAGGHELIPVDGAAASAIDGGVVPVEFAGWQQYRARIEGAFMRFFRSPGGRRWVVQGKDGTRYDLGELSPGEGAPELVSASVSALQSELPGGEGRIFGWCLTRSSDAHGNAVHYRYTEDQGQRYLDDIHYVAPASCGEGATPTARRNCTAPLSDYLHHVQLVYGARDDVFDSYASTWRITTAWRLARVEIFSALGDPGTRSFGWRYLLTYDDTSFHSMLTSVQFEGRPSILDPSTQSMVGELNVSEASVGDGTVGDLLPPMRFSYTETPATSTTTPGFGGFDATVHASSASPPVSVDGSVIDLADVNGDGLPDVISTDPARHRADGGPAMGVYFNGFAGSNAAPGQAGGFSEAVGVAVPPSLSHVARLSNANFVPMDIDGDGRGDFLHMPRTREYGYFAITRSADDGSVRPTAQDWHLSHVPTTLPGSFTDPRVDFGRDSTHLRTIDVNNDHLVDIVRTTGTQMQTWLNLGWLPDGDGRFGSAEFDGNEWVLSTEPIASCVLSDGRPFDFEDREARIADMNGDGLLDLVSIRRGRVVYWPGRDVGLWGEGGTECDPETTARNRYVEMDAAPAELNAELDGVMFMDVNADGASDVVQVRFDAVDVWYNRAGHGFSPRVTAMGTPFSPAYFSRIRVADMDGSGTSDIVYANAERWSWVSPAGVRRPRLLAAVDNGLGALTTFTYGSSVDDYLRDLQQAETCSDCERFTWSHVRGTCDARLQERSGECAYRSGGSPVVSTVVRSTSTTDRFDALGLEAHVATSRYAYHDGYYEGIEQEFRGFGAADAILVGDENHPTSTARTYFYQGRRPNDIATDRLADNPYEALKGRAYLSETFDEEGRVLGTSHTTWALRTLMSGLDGTNIVFGYSAQSDSLSYDHAPYVDLADTSVEVPAIRLEGLGGADAVVVETRDVAVRGDGWAHMRTSVDVMDDVGHALAQTAHGRIRGEFGEAPSEAITSQQTFERLLDSTGWLFAGTSSWVVGEGGEALGLSTVDYDAETGVPLRTATTASLSTAMAYEFLGDADGSAGYVQADQELLSSIRYDVWGNPLATCAGADLATSEMGCLRYAEVDYDETYMQFPVQERAAVSQAGGAWSFLGASAEWDVGLGKVTQSTDANGLVSEVGYDGFGRTTFVRAPDARGCEGTTVPNARITYELTVSPSSLPVSRITSISELSCAAIGTDTLVSVSFVDGAGRARAALSTGDEEHDWVVGGHTVFDAKGTARRSYQADFLDVANPTAAQVLALPTTPFTTAAHDAFGRVIQARAADGVVVGEARYHALSQDSCDANDIDVTSPHFDTCATSRVDGHGRAIDQIVRNRQPGIPGDEVHRLRMEYRNDGVVTRMARSETVSDAPDAPLVADHEVERLFFYDTTGRRLASTDPDTDSRDAAATAANRTWRYLFNRVGDMVAIRDPRGCGQNFYYDHAGRLLGEDYVSCGEAQPSGDVSDETVPGTAIALDVLGAPAFVDVRGFYDAYPGWAVGELAPPSGPTLGFALASADRGQRSVAAYDERGHGVWAARQIALIPVEEPLPLTSATVSTPDSTSGAPMSAGRVYDSSHTYVRTSSFDFADRPESMELPIDPDWVELGGTGDAPVVGGRIVYGRRGLVVRSELTMDGVARPVVAEARYLRDGLPSEVTYGDGVGRPPTVSTTTYDARRRPSSMRTDRAPTSMTGQELSAVSVVAAQRLIWDDADNLIELHDIRDASEWPDGFRPQTARVTHDALYRVAAVDYEYAGDDGWALHDDAQDWRAELDAANVDGVTHRSADPMRTNPAPSVAELPPGRVINLTYSTDWLANSTEWTDDAHSFYERSIGDITNGSIADGDRPAAMRLSTNLPDMQPAPSALERGGWVTLDYGESGNVVAMTVRAQCRDAATEVCFDDRSLDLDDRREHLEDHCVCDEEQHYEYLWDEVSRLTEARRYDRPGAGDWNLAVRQRYRYDGGFQRVVKETIAVANDGHPPKRATLYVYPGDFERRGVVADYNLDTYDAAVLDAETQYVVSGARVVWKSSAAEDPTSFGREQRITMPISNLIQSTGAVIDLQSGELLEASCYYPNGARESLRTQHDEGVATEPMGFTGKEADEEVGLVYFGARYLIPRIGRWASADPLETHRLEGGEVGNAYHYVSANLLQARDPIGLAAEPPEDATWKGLSWKERMNEGGIIHEAIITKYRAMHAGDLVLGDFFNTQARNIGQIYEFFGLELHHDSYAYSHKGKKPDIYNASTGEIWEIKPRRSAAAAAKQAAMYVARLAGLGTDPRSGRAHPMPGYEAFRDQIEVAGSNRVWIVDFQSQPNGTILYTARTKDERRRRMMRSARAISSGQGSNQDSGSGSQGETASLGWEDIAPTVLSPLLMLRGVPTTAASGAANGGDYGAAVLGRTAGFLLWIMPADPDAWQPPNGRASEEPA